MTLAMPPHISADFAFRVEAGAPYVVYDNPIPSMRSRHAYFPGLVALPDTCELLAMFSVGQAFESDDHCVHIARSSDAGQTWSTPIPIHADAWPGLGSMKPTRLSDGTLVAVGYRFDRDDPDALVNPATGGLAPGVNLCSRSSDGGRTWSLPAPMSLSRPELLEISGPCIETQSRELLALGTPLIRWDGTRPSSGVGVLLRSRDGGQTWDDSTCYFQHPALSPLEARLAQLSDGRLIAIVWGFDERAGRSATNHLVVSHDDGRTWSRPIDLGIRGQASNLLPLAGDRLLSIHAERENEPAGVVVRIVDLVGECWTTRGEQRVWSGAIPRAVSGFADMHATIKFGQPALLALGGDAFLAYFWAVENGQGRILARRFTLA